MEVVQCFSVPVLVCLAWVKTPLKQGVLSLPLVVLQDILAEVASHVRHTHTLL